MALAQFNDVRNDTPILAVRELKDLRAAGLRKVSPTVGAGILARRIPHVARLGIDHFRQLHTFVAAVLIGERRGFRRNRFIFAIREDEGVVAGTARRSGSGGPLTSACSTSALRSGCGCRLSTSVNGQSAAEPATTRASGWANAAARQADAHIDLVLEVIRT